MTFGSFTGRVFHQGQLKNNSNKILNCTKCLQEGHTFANCANDWVCMVCKKSGHKRIDCPGENTNQDVTESSDSETSEEESEPEPSVSSEQQTADQTLVSNSESIINSDSSPRRIVRADRNRRQQSMDRFVTPVTPVTPVNTMTSNRTERSPPTPAEELHDKLMKSKKKVKKNKSK
jgi:hypothetical protein